MHWAIRSRKRAVVSICNLMRLWRCIGAARNRVRWTFFNFIATIDVPVPDDLMFAAGVDRSVGPAFHRTMKDRRDTWHS